MWTALGQVEGVEEVGFETEVLGLEQEPVVEGAEQGQRPNVTMGETAGLTCWKSNVLITVT